MEQIKILVVEDDAIVAEDIANCLAELGHLPIGPAYDIETAKELANENPFQLALLDIHLEGREDGIILAAWIKEKFHLPIIFLTASSDSLTLSKVKEVHPEHYLVKPFNQAQLKAAIEITANNFYNPDPFQEKHAKIFKLNQKLNDPLTEREKDVLLMVDEGFSNQQISEKLFISENTVKTHLKNIFVKTASSSRTDLIYKLHQN
jgi:two-component system, response regulator PdtaR